MLKGFFKANPFRQQKLKVFAKGRANYYALIVPHNSPLKPILQRACTILMENGMLDFLIGTWEGKDIPGNGVVEVMILTAGQIILVFFIIAATFGFSGNLLVKRNLETD